MRQNLGEILGIFFQISPGDADAHNKLYLFQESWQKIGETFSEIDGRGFGGLKK